MRSPSSSTSPALRQPSLLELLLGLPRKTLVQIQIVHIAEPFISGGHQEAPKAPARVTCLPPPRKFYTPNLPVSQVNLRILAILRSPPRRTPLRVAPEVLWALPFRWAMSSVSLSSVLCSLRSIPWLRAIFRWTSGLPPVYVRQFYLFPHRLGFLGLS